MRPTFDNLVNFDRPDRKDEVWNFIGPLTGDYEVTIKPRRLSISDKQRAYYFKEIVGSFSAFLASQDYEDCSKEHAHGLLKDKFLKTEVFNNRTGEFIGGRTRSITELSRPEMSTYIDNCRDWLLGYFRIKTRDPDPAWREHRDAEMARRSA